MRDFRAAVLVCWALAISYLSNYYVKGKVILTLFERARWKNISKSVKLLISNIRQLWNLRKRLH
jgi:hypothetical protein